MQHLFLSTFCTVEAIECHLKPDSILTLSAIDYLRPEGFTQLRCQLYHLELCSVLPTVFSCLLFALFCITLPSVLLSLSSCSCVRCLAIAVISVFCCTSFPASCKFANCIILFSLALLCIRL